eukprot:scaffold77586_cov21-Prasinocladus_malaysianus.AAC.1
MENGDPVVGTLHYRTVTFTDLGHRTSTSTRRLPEFLPALPGLPCLGLTGDGEGSRRMRRTLGNEDRYGSEYEYEYEYEYEFQ